VWEREYRNIMWMDGCGMGVKGNSDGCRIERWRAECGVGKKGSGWW
jgi:hypothetical protein